MLSLKLGTELKFDLSSYNEIQENYIGSNSTRDFGLPAFNININVASEKEIKRFQPPKFLACLSSRYINLAGLFFKFKNILFQRNILFEISFVKYNPKYENIIRNSYLNGYWHSELYFKKYSEIIRSDFTINKPIYDSYKPYYELINNCESVSLHVRRGDYLNNKYVISLGNDNNGLYYKNAINEIQKKIKREIVFFVFSDDIIWCKKNLIFNNKVIFVMPELQNDIDELHLMSHCSHNIIANSTFSWWGAWLNPNKEKVVIAPKKWFTQEHININDIVPKDWIML
jgi:hypothetical protein